MLFRKNKKNETKTTAKPAHKGLEILSVIAKDTHLLGTLISDGSIDFDGTIDGNIRAHILTIRKNGRVNGDITVDTLNVYGKVDGLVKAKHVHLYKHCHVEGVIMHETLIIEDGAFMDGKCKRSDRSTNDDTENETTGSGMTIPPIRLIN